MQKQQEKYAYNFNPRLSLKDTKLRYLIRTNIMGRQDVPIGKYPQHKQYQTACKATYIAYHHCLQSHKFDRALCLPFENEVITCQHRQGLYPTNQQIIERLTKGLVNDRKKKLAINQKYQRQHNRRKYTRYSDMEGNSFNGRKGTQENSNNQED